MLLERLREHATTLNISPPMYEKVPIRWFIDLDKSGSLLGFVPLTEGSDDKKRSRKDRGKRLAVPDIVRSSGIRPKLLADNGEYVLGIARDPDKQARVDEAHAQFKELVRLCAEETGEPLVRSVFEFLNGWGNGSREELPEDFDPADNLTFRIGVNLPVDLPKVRSFWSKYTAEATSNPDMECLVCGTVGPVESNLPVKVKGIPGGQSAGTSLVSANTNAFESYGLKRSLISPICRDCGERFGKTLNALIQDEKSRLVVGPLVYVFWTSAETGFEPVSLLGNPDGEAVSKLIFGDSEPEEVLKDVVLSRQDTESIKAVLHSPVSGRGATLDVIDSNAFYATALSASGGRVIVRHWLETTVVEAIENLKRWFLIQRLADRESATGRPYGIFALAASLYHDVKKIDTQVPALLIQTALHGGSLPLSLLAQAVRRNRAEQGITRNRATLIKMIFASQGGKTMEDRLVAVNYDHPDPAYHCGRLMAHLEALQERVIPGIKATITDRYFGSASSAPESVFGVLIRDAQAHLSKLRKDEAAIGAYRAIQTAIGQTLGRIGDRFPTTLDFKAQAMFSLGYYHQREASIAAAIARKKEKGQGENNVSEPIKGDGK